MPVLQVFLVRPMLEVLLKRVAAFGHIPYWGDWGGIDGGSGSGLFCHDCLTLQFCSCGDGVSVFVKLSFSNFGF